MSFPIIVPSASDASTFPTLADFYVPLAKKLGSYALVTVTSTPTGEPGRWIIADEMADDELARAQIAGSWVYVKSGSQAGTQRRIRNEGYEGAYGALALSRVLPSNLAVSTFVEVTKPLPVRTEGQTHGLVEFINEALNSFDVEVRLPMNGNGTSSYNLADVPILQGAQIDGVYDYRWGLTTEPAVRSPFAAGVRVDGATLSLETGFSYVDGETFEVRALVPADRVTFDGSAWGYAATGLVNDTDRAAAPTEWVTPIAFAKALEWLIDRTQSDETLSDAVRQRTLTRYGTRLQRITPTVNYIRTYLLPRVQSRRSSGLLGYSGTMAVSTLGRL